MVIIITYYLFILYYFIYDDYAWFVYILSSIGYYSEGYWLKWLNYYYIRVFGSFSKLDSVRDQGKKEQFVN
jgi:hypothetical protein